MTVAGRLPSWKAFICDTRNSFGCPARAGTSLVALRPSVPWQLAQVAARLRATALSWALAANAAHVSTAPSAILGIIWAPPSCNPKIKGSGDGRGFFLELQLDLLVVADIDAHPAAVLEPPEKQLVGQRSPDRVLDEPCHGPRAHQRIEALLRQVLLLDLVEQQYRVGLLGDRLGEQAALLEADVSRRCADQARHRVPLHVLGHVEADQLDAHAVGQLPRHLRLADAGGSREQEVAYRL